MFTDSRIQWSSVLNELEKSFKGHVLSFMELEKYHLILLNPVNKDYLLHFVNGGDNGRIACHAVNREGIFDEIEGDAVVREISAVTLVENAYFKNRSLLERYTVHSGSSIFRITFKNASYMQSHNFLLSTRRNAPKSLSS
jgi:hypothetical protein